MINRLICQNLVGRKTGASVSKIFFQSLNFNKNFSSFNSDNSKVKLNDETLKLLETLSLVNFENEGHVEAVEEAIAFANKIECVDTTNVEPLISVLENCNLKLRDDIITDGNCREEILLNASMVEENYFVAPPGNIPVNENFAYLKPIFVDSVVSHFKYGPLGELLRQNIHNEWIFSNSIHRDVNAYPFCSVAHETPLLEGITDHYFQAKKINGDFLPFSITYARMPIVQDVGNSFSSEESKYFRAKHVTALKCFTFTTSEEGSRFFHYWLRQRKIWWRKFSANPTRFSLSNINNVPEEMEVAHIQSEFPWGVELVEEVKLYSENIFKKLSVEEQDLWTLRRGKHKIFPAIIESVTNLETACFTFLCDSFCEDVRLDTGLPHQLIRLHRKLAPYKVAIVVDSKDNDLKEDLLHLAEYLVLNLKKNAVPTLFLSRKDTKNNEEWFQYYDLLAIPFVAVLESSTLNDGILGLRSRETTLQERLHITKLSEYMIQLLKNY